MKRLSGYFLLFLLTFSVQHVKSQAFNASVTPGAQCYNPALGSNTAIAAITATAPLAVSYSWTIVPPNATPSCAALFTNAVPNGSIIGITFPCCGEYTINAFAFTAASVQVGNVQASPTPTIFCPTGATIVPSTAGTIVCSGIPMTLTGNGATTFTWISSAGGGGTTTVGLNPLTITPTANATYTLTGFNANGCLVTNTIALAVQSATFSAGPASQSICVNSPLCFTTSAGAQSGANVTPGTVTTSIQWLNPSAVAVAQCTSPAAQGTYTAILTHTGAAGTCTLEQTAQVFTTSTIPVTLTASSASICPNGTVQLTSISAQTSAVSGHVWAQSFGGPIINTGNPIVRTIATLPRTFTVTPNYFGCTGSATITIGLLTLTPTLTPSSFSVCPNTPLTLTATGGVNYTFTAIPSLSPNVVLSTAPGVNTVAHTPTVGFGQFPWQYAVSAFSAGCVGSSTIAINIRTINPIFTSSAFNNSVCPNTNFTLTSSGGAGTSYTFVAPPSATVQTGATNTISQSSATFPSTYTVAVDSAGCSGTATISMNVLSLNPIVSLSTPSVCEGTAFSFTSSGGAGTTYTFFAPTFTTPATSSVVPKGPASEPFATHIPVFNPTLNTTYTVQVDSAGCVGSNTFSVGILNLSPNLGLSMFNVNGPLTNACPNSPLTLTATAGLNPSNFSYTFTAPPPLSFTNTGNVPNLSLNAPAAASLFPATYTVAVDSAGCVGTRTVNLALRVLNRGVIAGSASVCAGTSVVICAIPGTSLTTYQFVGISPTQTLVQPTLPSTNPCFTFNPVDPTIYSVLADSAGCTNLAAPIQSVLVGITPSLTIGALASPSIICSGLPSTLSVQGSTAYTYTWTAPSGTNAVPIGNGTTTAVNPTITTNYTVNALDAAGCIGIQTVALVVDPTASLSMVVSAPFNTVCVANPSLNLPQQSNTLTASGAVNYSWSPPLFLSSTTTSITITTPTTTIIYTVTGNNNLGCNGAAQFTMSVNQYPPVSITPNPSQNVCPGFTSTLTAFNAQTYTWTGTTFTTPIVQQSISVGPGTYTVLGSNGGSCLNFSVITIGVAPPLNINLSYANNTSTTCIMNNFPKLAKPVTLNASGAANYVWLPYDPATMTYSIGPQTLVRPHTSTCYTVTGNTSVCSGSAVICVTVVPQFTIGATPQFPAMCLGDSLKLSVVNIGPGAVGSPAAFTYSWTEAQNAPPISMSAYLTPTTMVFPQNTTTYSVDVTDTRTCVSLPRLITVTVLPAPQTDILLPIINNVPTNTVCFVGPSPGPPDVLLNLTASNVNSGLPFGIQPTYTWTSPNNSILTPNNNAQITINAPNRLPSIIVYTVLSGYNGVNGCRVFDTVSVRVVDCRPITVVSYTTANENDTICARSCITFMNLTDTLAGSPQTFTWSFAGGAPATSTLANPTVCYNLPGEYDVILTVENPYPINGGGSSGIKGISKFIKVVDIPNVTISPPGQLSSNQYINFGGTAVLSGTGAYSYIWDPPYNISSLTNPNVTVSPIQTTQYVLWGYNSKQCFSSDTVNVIVIKDCGEMYVPNAFSPNGDGHNDDLKVMGICLESMTFMVFNRWGEKIFETTDQRLGWDGTYKEKEVESGVYVYRLEGKTFDGKGFSSKGNVTLLR